MKDNNNNLAHAISHCMRSVVFAPKYRIKAFYGSKRLEIGTMLRKLCEWKVPT